MFLLKLDTSDDSCLVLPHRIDQLNVWVPMLFEIEGCVSSPGPVLLVHWCCHHQSAARCAGCAQKLADRIALHMSVKSCICQQSDQDLRSPLHSLGHQ